MIVRLMRSSTPSGGTHYNVREPRRDHFRKTLFLAGVAAVLALCVYVLSHASFVQANGNADAPVSSVAAGQ